MTKPKKTIFGSLLASLFALCGCGQPAPGSKVAAEAPKVIEEIKVAGFDPDGEPVIKKWSDGSLGIYFEAMSPFFAEENAAEAEFEEFELQLQTSLGVAVRRDDREVFVISQPAADTAAKAKAWLESYRKREK